MYNLDNNAIGVQKGLNKRWETIDLSAISVSALYATYRIVQITLTPQNSTEPQYLLLSEQLDGAVSFDGTFQQYLATLGNTALPTHTQPYVLDAAIARFHDAFRLRYRIRLVDADNVEPPVVFDADDYDHIRIDREDVTIDAADAVANVLVNINGFYHPAKDIGGRGLFIKDAMKSVRLSQQNQVGLWDFRELGGITVLPTIPGALAANGASGFQVNLTQDLTHKTVFFVIAGYFIPVDGTLAMQTGERSFYLNFEHVNFRAAARYYEAANYIDLSSLATLAAGQTPGSLDVSKLTSPDAVAAWLALDQSFVVIVNRQHCYTAMRYVKRTGNPNQYLCYLDRLLSTEPNAINNPRLRLDPPQLPLALELGRHPPYWITTEGWVHALSIYNNRVGQLLYESGQPADSVLTSGADQPGSPGLLQHAYLLEFGSDVKEPSDPSPP